MYQPVSPSAAGAEYARLCPPALCVHLCGRLCTRLSVCLRVCLSACLSGRGRQGGEHGSRARGRRRLRSIGAEPRAPARVMEVMCPPTGVFSFLVGPDPFFHLHGMEQRRGRVRAGVTGGFFGQVRAPTSGPFWGLRQPASQPGFGSPAVSQTPCSAEAGLVHLGVDDLPGPGCGRDVIEVRKENMI